MLPLTIVGTPNFAPPGCKKVTLGVNVYPLPELTMSILEIDPLTTVAFNSAFLDPSRVDSSITTVGGFVSLYPLPPLRRVEFLIPFTKAVADAAEPPPLELIETFGGY